MKLLANTGGGIRVNQIREETRRHGLENWSVMAGIFN